MNQKTIPTIHLLLEKTIADRNKILPLWEDIFISDKPVEKDIHAQLEETIKMLKRTKKQVNCFFEDDRNKVYSKTVRNAT